MPVTKHYPYYPLVSSTFSTLEWPGDEANYPPNRQQNHATNGMLEAALTQGAITHIRAAHAEQ